MDASQSQIDSKTKSRFAVICRDLRVQKGLKQREVASIIGVKLSTYGNVESSHWKVINRDRASKLIAFYRLSPFDAAALLAAWEQCPLSPNGEKRREVWRRRNELRSKAKNHDRLQLALIELLGARLMDLADDMLCACEFGEPACLTCSALESLGIQAYTSADREKILAQLDKLREKLLAARAPMGGAS